MNKAIYIADIDQDIDDIIAIDLLHSEGALEGVVLDPYPRSDLGLERVKQIESMGIPVFRDIPKCDYIFNGGAFTKLSNYLARNRVKAIVANGGYVGDSLTLAKDVIDKFKGSEYFRTYNFNCDVMSALSVLNSKSYDDIFLIGKNICHSEKNTTFGMWKGLEILNKYNLKGSKRLHDVLMVQEGIKIINGNMDKSILVYAKGTPVVKENKGRNSIWGTKAGGRATIAIGWK